MYSRSHLALLHLAGRAINLSLKLADESTTTCTTICRLTSYQQPCQPHSIKGPYLVQYDGRWQADTLQELAHIGCPAVWVSRQPDCSRSGNIQLLQCSIDMGLPID